MDEVRRADLRALIAEMAGLTPSQRMRRWGLKADRADVILPASLVYLAFAEEAGAKRILVPHVGLRESVALDLLLSSHRRDARDRLERAAGWRMPGRKR